MIIDEPAALVKEFKGAAAGDQWLNASDWGRYSRGSCGDGVTVPEDCSDLSVCFGPRVSLVDPIAADFELVDDGSADPTLGCGDLIGFTPGNIAVIERGVCEFGTKGKKAMEAGAAAVFMVNDGRCGDFFPDSPKCALGMLGGVDGPDVTIPVVQVSVNDGQPILDALLAATPVRGRFGAVSSNLTLDANVFSAIQLIWIPTKRITPARSTSRWPGSSSMASKPATHLVGVARIRKVLQPREGISSRA